MIHALQQLWCAASCEVLTGLSWRWCRTAGRTGPPTWPGSPQGGEPLGVASPHAAAQCSRQLRRALDRWRSGQCRAVTACERRPHSPTARYTCNMPALCGGQTMCCHDNVPADEPKHTLRNCTTSAWQVALSPRTRQAVRRGAQPDQAAFADAAALHPTRSTEAEAAPHPHTAAANTSVVAQTQCQRCVELCQASHLNSELSEFGSQAWQVRHATRFSGQHL